MGQGGQWRLADGDGRQIAGEVVLGAGNEASVLRARQSKAVQLAGLVTEKGNREDFAEDPHTRASTRRQFVRVAGQIDQLAAVDQRDLLSAQESALMRNVERGVAATDD